ncbi:hypothetical protein GFC29_102 [Anoxybacillus sp. B7M1]|nr:hypothetical protein GFC28_1526 [Anoxybacillus sp. B2M1]ANB63834.1 hypothetical protein GFC29_102 [Anoxybacillus sp. B7M1]
MPSCISYWLSSHCRIFRNRQHFAPWILAVIRNRRAVFVDNADDVAAVVGDVVERIAVLVRHRIWFPVRPRKRPYGLAVVQFFVRLVLFGLIDNSVNLTIGNRCIIPRCFFFQAPKSLSNRNALCIELDFLQCEMGDKRMSVTH